MQFKPARLVALIAATTLANVSSMHAPSQANAAELDHYRQLLIYDFSASMDLISFPVPLAPDTAGLVVIDRKTGRQKLIHADSVIMRSPFLSSDGKRLLFVQRRTPGTEKELVSCAVADWNCEILLKTTDTVFSPIELSPNRILYSSSPMRTVNNALRADYHDLFLLDKGKAPVQLTKLDAYQLTSISVGAHRIVFSAVGHFNRTEYLPAPTPMAQDNSDIYSVEFAPSEDKIIFPELPLRRLFPIEGQSANPSIAPDGRYIAFLNRRNEKGQTHFNLVVAEDSGKIIQYFQTQQFSYSQPKFVDGTIIANELHPNHYEIKQFEISGGKVRTHFRLDSSVKSLMGLDSIGLSLAN